MKCRQCGKELEKKNKTCPHCGYVNSLENLLKKVEVPDELDHLSMQQLQSRMKIQHFLFKGRYVILGILLVGLIATISMRYLNDTKKVAPIPNFHDDLVESTTSNATGNSIGNLVNGGLVLQYGDTLFAADKNGVSNISLTLDKKTIVYDKEVSYLNASDQKIYFIDQTKQNSICFFDVTTKTIENLNVQATQLVVVGDYLYYLEDNANRSVYQMHRETLATKKMTQSECVQFKIIGDWLYFATKDALYQMPVLGGEIMKIADEYYPHFYVDNQYIYYIDSSTNFIHRVKKDGSEDAVIVKQASSCFLMTDTYLFYNSSESGLYKQHRETGEVSKITADKADRLHIAGTWIYYLTTSNEGRFVSVDEKSEMITPVDVISDTQ